MLSLILRTIKTKKNSILAYSLTGMFFMWMYVSIFPTFEKEQESFSELIEKLPAGIMEAFGISVEVFSDLSLESFLSTEQFSLIWPIMAIALMISFGGISIAGEIEKKTIDILLSQPVSRLRLFVSRYISAFIGYIAFIIVSVYSVIPFAQLYGIDYQLTHYNTLTVLALFFGLAVFSMSMLASSIFSEKGKSNLIVAGIIIVMYAVRIVALMIESLENLKYTSLFYYFDTTKALHGNELNLLSLYAFSIVIIACTSLAAFIFNKRDISV